MQSTHMSMIPWKKNEPMCKGFAIYSLVVVSALLDNSVLAASFDCPIPGTQTLAFRRREKKVKSRHATIPPRRPLAL